MAFVIASVEVHQWWVGREAVLTDRISVLERGIAARDVKIKAQDKALAELKHKDSAIVVTIAARTEELQSTKADLTNAEQAIEADAAAHEGLVPIAEVHTLELKEQLAIKSCENLGAEKDQRIDNLLAQLANKDTARALLDTNRVDETKVLKDTVSILKPPWIKRFVGWIDDHVVTLIAGAAAGAAGAIALTKK